jgi:hypothetical protein
MQIAWQKTQNTVKEKVKRFHCERESEQGARSRDPFNQWALVWRLLAS